ncbi:hypothetical protein TVAG_273980 [Trichomonas vaginalis G3]|uniref:Uncharacterized protein n=1 Tax=Trichomonas vaginalis (strain ATCC PRA-98 / G3) TaxID=412133 RepID=A2FSM9_TRIV3|nr:hypothetical protein TVAGG3_0200930 [Trichomonas vaginalis G3]EAX92085.1 hypothetical protein TVAG_273980 [Trichomonas vaginalis G3]KAI5550594.1 hypothetical protein TVAGG3_0200930 [Trichomonas vaginalis G3]|eukprot:XP_001305015.1 hypothetical protein [Trichomonas vaginalis G3]
MSAEPAHQEGAPQAMAVYPMTEMNGAIRYQLMYLPIYVSNEDTRIYQAGQPLVQLPGEKPTGFLDSLSQTLSIAGNKINKAIQPVTTKVEAGIHTASAKISETATAVANKTSEKYHEVKNKMTSEKPAAEEPPKEEQPKEEQPKEPVNEATQ